MKKIISAIIALCMFTTAFAQTQTTKDRLYSNKFSLLFGTIQPTMLKGFNVEVNYTTKRVIFDYSHGLSLDPPTAGDFKAQNLSIHLPYSTGFGIGYRFNSFFDLRFEPKLHSWELYDASDAQNATTMIRSFKTFSLGLGAYYRYMPFKNSNSKVLQGITTSSSFRYWQNVGSTLSNDEMTYFNKSSNKSEQVKAPNIGIANTPLIFNIAIGYTFGGK
ncbi:MAG: hypothetical protein RL660_2764 [Bacteroidota bacterium]|jgi:hypothetical protein